VDGDFSLEPMLAEEDIGRAAEVMQLYQDVPIGFVDSAVTAIAERTEVVTLLTTDRRHFPIFRPRHVPSFILEP
jgi:predicted nucleic acid-binding protein